MRRIITIFVLLLTVLPCRAAEAPADSVSRTEVFRPSKLIAPAVLFTAGAVGVNWDWYASNINIPIKNYAGDLRTQYGPKPIDNWIQYAPITAYVALGAFGIGDHSFAEILCAGATAYATMGVVVNAIKYTVCEMRPDGSARNSFPSGHSATAFMGAELIRLEYGGWAGVGAYTVATATAALRVYNNRHWFNDLLGGAAIGIVSANVGYWLLPLERRLLDDWFGMEIGSRPGAEIAIIPVAAPSVGTSVLGFAVSCRF